MKKYYRMIDPLCWESWEEKKVKNIPADSITKDIETCRNTLSLWELCPDEAVLAIISSSEEIKPINILAIDEKMFRNKKIDVKKAEKQGKSKFKELNKHHYDTQNMTYKKLGGFSEIILKSLKSRENLKEYTYNQVKEILKKGIKNKEKEKDVKLRDKMIINHGEELELSEEYIEEIKRKQVSKCPIKQYFIKIPV